MTHYIRNSEMVDQCPACGTLHIGWERGRVVARVVDGGAECTHTFQQREAMRRRGLKKLREEARQEQHATKAKRRGVAA